MSKAFLRNLTSDEYLELSKTLFDYQNGKCYICESTIENLDESNILALNNCRKFKIGDYALCHKKCNVEGLKDECFLQYIKSFEWMEGLASVCHLSTNITTTPPLQPDVYAIDTNIEVEEQDNEEFLTDDEFQGYLNEVGGIYGKLYDKHIIERLPEFNYFQENPFARNNFEQKNMLPVIRKINSYFNSMLRQALFAESQEEAIELYKTLIINETYIPDAYSNLASLYLKIGRIEDSIKIYKRGIEYFERRLNWQTEYVRSLAKKYNAEAYCEMCIRTSRKIRYYCGDIILYQEYPFINKWKQKLIELQELL